MCQVQRVVNSCGHRNDHVLISCYFAKNAFPSPSASRPDNTNNTSASGTSTGDTTSPAAAITTAAALAADADADTTTSSTSQTQRVPTQPQPQMADKIAKSGFDARTGPYCVYANIRTLVSPRGFMCMVHSCGRAD
ncbi:hypothetical protein ARAM_001769 [Aspergillus rambellii]|uniref:Uncharacterized protein n=1 Tax=Aspergillus rambellii TaxID=308745 RepID=A0A0F8UZW6_9EURO|nr:hypothetical protein ARAM_001769 [Aspergillus rambellii]